MKVTIDREDCISCGVCTSTCPEVFQFAEDGLASVISDNPEAYKESVTEARDGCPVSIISIED